MGAMLLNAFILPESILCCDEDGCMAPFSSGATGRAAWYRSSRLQLLLLHCHGIEVMQQQLP
jgi:hypothetical protein